MTHLFESAAQQPEGFSTLTAVLQRWTADDCQKLLLTRPTEPLSRSQDFPHFPPTISKNRSQKKLKSNT